MQTVYWPSSSTFSRPMDISLRKNEWPGNWKFATWTSTRHFLLTPYSMPLMSCLNWLSMHSCICHSIKLLDFLSRLRKKTCPIAGPESLELSCCWDFHMCGDEDPYLRSQTRLIVTSSCHWEVLSKPSGKFYTFQWSWWILNTKCVFPASKSYRCVILLHHFHCHPGNINWDGKQFSITQSWPKHVGKQTDGKIGVVSTKISKHCSMHTSSAEPKTLVQATKTGQKTAKLPPHLCKSCWTHGSWAHIGA